jgi:oxalate decarboxylase
MGEMHWHSNAGEWQYWIKGKGTMTVSTRGQRDDDEPQSGRYRLRQVELRALHQEREQHPSTAALSTLRGLRGRHRQSDWITHTPPEMAAQTSNLSTEAIAKFPRGKPEIAPT